MKRFITLVLAVCLVFACSINTLAGSFKSTDITSDNHTLTDKATQQDDIITFNKQLYNYNALTKDLKKLKKRYRDYMNYHSIGQSAEGRDIYEIVMGNEESDEHLIVVCEMHAREYVTSIVIMKEVEYLLKNYNKKIDGKKISKLLKKTCLHIIPMLNPDGIEIVANKDPMWKANANGVNLNNNFPYHHKPSGSATAGNYTGKKALSEPEAFALSTFVRKLHRENNLAIINYHATGSIVFGSLDSPNSYTNKITKKMYDIARQTTGFADAAYYDQSNGSRGGSFRDYCMIKLLIPSITIELGRTDCPISMTEYSRIYEQNKYVIPRILDIEY